MKRIEQILYSPLYPLLYSIFPVLSMFSNNLFHTYAYTIITPLIFSFLLGLISLLVFKRWFNDWHSAALTSSVTLLLFFSYGHILDSKQLMITNFHYILPVFWIFLLFIAILGIVRLRRIIVLSIFAPALNMMAIILLLFPIERLIYIGLLSIYPITYKVDHSLDLSNANKESRPDIYYIVLDGYGRSDLLKQEFNYDNKEFLATLTEMGFIIADCSQSNYPNTQLSIASALNLDYMQSLSSIFLKKKVDLFYYAQALKNNFIERSLKTAGYTTVTFASGFPLSEPDVDLFLNPLKINSINEFDVLFMRTTFLRVIDQFFYPLYAVTDYRYRQRLEFALNSNDKLSQVQSPKFVFMHILSSHIPYVIDHNGKVISPEYRNSDVGYVEQTQYSSLALVELVRKIISTSKKQPIIVIQGDHGSFLESEETNSFLIINAYFLPDHSNLIYSTISPVNTFRVILNGYFDTNFLLLDDVSFLPDNSKPDGFTIVPNNCGTQNNK
jgi:hypothetical protein